ncbi:MAG TPA: cytochrome C oxidase subunit IV family protein [Acidimicrobiales bacterium]|jgi:cytochrome c oxidase subunit IV
MSVETEERGAAGPLEPDHEAHQHAHPRDRDYLIVAAILAVITALEVGTYFIEDASTTLLVASLFPMMIAKFAIVCGWFMHLRYDNPLFRRVFVFGLLLAVAVYIIVLLSMEWFSSAYPTT